MIPQDLNEGRDGMLPAVAGSPSSDADQACLLLDQLADMIREMESTTKGCSNSADAYKKQWEIAHERHRFWQEQAERRERWLKGKDARIAALEDAIRWALGEHESDGFREQCCNEGKYWWRKELRERVSSSPGNK